MAWPDKIEIIQKDAIELVRLLLGLKFATRPFLGRPPRIDPTFIKLMFDLVKHLELDPKSIKFDLKYYERDSEQADAQLSANNILSDLLATIEENNDSLSITSNSQVANIIIQLKLMLDLYISHIKYTERNRGISLINYTNQNSGWQKILEKLETFIEKHQFFYAATAIEKPAELDALKRKCIEKTLFDILKLADDISINISHLLEQPTDEEIKCFLVLSRPISSTLQEETQLRQNAAQTYSAQEQQEILNTLSLQLTQLAATFEDISPWLPKDKINTFDFILSQLREIIYVFMENRSNKQILDDFDTAFENFSQFQSLHQVIKDYQLKIEEQKVSDIVSKILDIKRADKNKEWKLLIESHLAQLQTVMASLPQAALQSPVITNQLAYLRDVLALYNIELIERTPSLPASNHYIDSLQEKVKTQLIAHNTQEVDNDNSNKNEDAASDINQSFLEDPFQLYQSMLEEANDFDALAVTMFGNTVARINNVSIPFHTTAPSLWKSKFYHRSDQLDVYELFANRIVAYGGVNGEVYRQGNHDYIPILLVGDELGHGILENYAENIPAKFLASPDDENDVLAFVECSKKDSETLRKIFKTAGLIASPWTLSMAALRDKTTAAVRPTQRHEALATYLASLPSDWEKFKTSEDMQKLVKLSENPQLPTHLLAVSLLHLLQGLERYPAMNANALQRVALFLHLAVTFQAQNYENFACLLHAMVHEISLHINKHMQTHPISYEDFKRETIDNAIAYFGLDEPTDEKNATYQFIVAPSASGAHAFANAMALVRYSNLPGDKINKKVIGDNYYENVALEENSIRNWGYNVYLISGGPIVSLEHSVGIDINKLIHEVIDPATADQSRGVIIVIDGTSALYKNLKLDDVAKKYVESGILSIIVHESKQKFGLLHTDQAQYGRVFAVCGKKMFNKFNLQQFVYYVENDFARHVDMQIGAYLSIYSKLEDVKERHFINAAICNEILSPHAILKPVAHDPQSLNTDETCFTTLSTKTLNDKIHLNNLVRSIIPNRDSYGHFHSSFAIVGNTIRISANASDTIDTLIVAQALHLSLSLSLAMTKTVLHELIMAKTTEKLSLEKEILLVSTLLALLSKSTTKDYATMYYLTLGTQYLADHASHLQDRLVLQKLMRYCDTITKSHAEIVMPLLKHDDPAINIKIAEALTILANSKSPIPEMVFAALQPENAQAEKFASVICLLTLIPAQHDLVVEFCAAYSRDVAILDLIADIEKYQLPMLHSLNIVFDRLRSNTNIEISAIVKELISAANFNKTANTLFSDGNQQKIVTKEPDESPSSTLSPNASKASE